MDLKDLTPKTDEIVVTIKHPVSGEVLKNDDSSDMVITVYAPHSKEYKKVQRELITKRLNDHPFKTNNIISQRRTD